MYIMMNQVRDFLGTLINETRRILAQLCRPIGFEKLPWFAGGATTRIKSTNLESLA